MASKHTAPYGQWNSPLTAELVAGSSISLHEVAVDVRTTLMNERVPLLTSSRNRREQSTLSNAAPLKTVAMQSYST